jgi:hypothetical protein
MTIETMLLLAVLSLVSMLTRSEERMLTVAGISSTPPCLRRGGAE